MTEEGRLGSDVYINKDEYGEDGYEVQEISINPIRIKEQVMLKQLFELLEIPIPSRFFGHTEITIKTKELDSNKIYSLFSEVKNG